VGTTTHRNESSSVDNTIVGKTSCALCFQWVACFRNGVFIGTHTPDFERVRTDDFARLFVDSLYPKATFRVTMRDHLNDPPRAVNYLSYCRIVVGPRNVPDGPTANLGFTFKQS
jgi:hypothetical protein